MLCRGTANLGRHTEHRYPNTGGVDGGQPCSGFKFRVSLVCLHIAVFMIVLEFSHVINYLSVYSKRNNCPVKKHVE